MDLHNFEISPNTYYTRDEAAAMLRVSRRSMQNLLAAGHARGVKIGRAWRILGSDLLRLPRIDTASETDLTHGLLHLSEPAFTEVWNNDEDAVYDAL